MIYWAQLLHFYQPPTQSHRVLARVCHESYRPLLQVFRDYPYARVTVNMCGVLTEMLSEHGHGDIIEMLKELAKNGQIEFTGSGKYHPILPLIPKGEVERQIMENARTNRQFLDSFIPKGFFPPELCYSYDIVEPVLRAGHRWIILSGVACPVNWPVDRIDEIEFEGESLAVLFRDDILSNKISFRSITSNEFLEHVRQLGVGGENSYVITAMDAETFGHHIKNWEIEFLAKVYEQLQPAEQIGKPFQPRMALAKQTCNPSGIQGVQMVCLSELLDIFPRGAVIQPKASSWSTSKEDIESSDFYPLWRSKSNEIHKLQWKHLEICLDMVRKASAWADNEESRNLASTARYFMDLALHSDQFWWANGKSRWDINLVHKGLLFQKEVILNAYKAINITGIDSFQKNECYYRLAAARELERRIVDKLLEENPKH